jgi:hypothetical protein
VPAGHRVTRRVRREIPRGVVSEEFRAELEWFLGGDALGVHAGRLLTDLKGGQPDLAGLFAYGMAHLPRERRRPDDALAIFFTIVSEIAQCPADLRDFATRCSEYCESDARDGWSDTLAELKSLYRDLRSRHGWSRIRR